MLSGLSSYSISILSAMIFFPFVAALITLPVTIYYYRKFGGISVVRTVIVFSFAFYLLTVFFLTALPLPPIDKVAAMDRIHFNWIPFRNFWAGIKKCGLEPENRATWFRFSIWKKYLLSGNFFQIVANVIMTIPFGMYLRYYFRRNAGQTVLFGFLLSLTLEMIQLSGLFFIYPQPYRCPDINDLMANTLGAWIGYLVLPLFERILPPRTELDTISKQAGLKVTAMRRIIATTTDWVLLAFLNGVISMIWDYVQTRTLRIDFKLPGVPLAIILYFGILQYLWKGRTFGKKCVHLKAVSTEDLMSPPPLKHYMIRYILLYIVYPMIAFTDMAIWGATAILFVYDNSGGARLLAMAASGVVALLTVLFLMHTIRKGQMLPHDYYSHITIEQTHKGEY